MGERVAEANIPKGCGPDSRLRDYLAEKLKLSKDMERLHAAGDEFTPEIDARDKSLRTKKVRVLDDIIFQAMANLTFFFRTIALHPELQQIFESDIMDLLGIKHKNSQEYGFMLIDLLQSILLVGEGQKEQSMKRDDFRLKLNSKIQGIVIEKARSFLPVVFKNVSAEHAVWEDLGRAWAWTAMMATDKEFGDPHRTFDLNTSEPTKKLP